MPVMSVIIFRKWWNETALMDLQPEQKFSRFHKMLIFSLVILWNHFEQTQIIFISVGWCKWLQVEKLKLEYTHEDTYQHQRQRRNSCLDFHQGDSPLCQPFVHFSCWLTLCESTGRWVWQSWGHSEVERYWTSLAVVMSPCWRWCCWGPRSCSGGSGRPSWTVWRCSVAGTPRAAAASGSTQTPPATQLTYL